MQECGSQGAARQSLPTAPLLATASDVLQRADDVGDALDAGSRQRRRQRVEHFHRRRWIVEVHGAELNRRCAGDEEFHHVVDRGDAADADDRRFRRPGRPGRRHRRAIGLMAGPLRPPITLPSIGRRRRQSIAMPRQVLMSEMASAPPAAAALAIVGDAGHVRRQLGDDRRGGRAAAIGDEPFAHRRRRCRSRRRRETFGQEMFSSTAAMPAQAVEPRASSRRTRRACGRRC